MTDDLVKQSIAELQDFVRCRPYMVDAVRVVADRIDELEADLRKMALDYLAAQGQASENFQMYVDANEARIDAEAKLAKAVEALEEIATDEHPLGWVAIAALAELKAEK